MSTSKKYNFVRFYCDHTPLVYDLLREKIFPLLTFDRIFIFRRVCKSFEKLISEIVIEKDFDRETQIKILQPRNRGLNVDKFSEIICNKEDLICVLHTLKFRSYQFHQDRKLIETFLTKLDKKRHCHRVDELYIDLPSNVTEEEYSELNELSRYREIGELEIVSDRLNRTMNRLFQSQLAISALTPYLIANNHTQKVSKLVKHCFSSGVRISSLCLSGIVISEEFVNMFLSDETFPLLERLFIDTWFSTLESGASSKDVERFLSGVKVKNFRFLYNIPFRPTTIEEYNTIEGQESKLFQTLEKNRNIRSLEVSRNGSFHPIHLKTYRSLLQSNPNLENLVNLVRCDQSGSTGDLYDLCDIISRHKNIRKVSVYVKFASQPLSDKWVDAFIGLLQTKNRPPTERDVLKCFEFSVSIWRYQDDGGKWDVLKLFLEKMKRKLKELRYVKFNLKFRWNDHVGNLAKFERDSLNGMLEEFFNSIIFD